MSDHAPALQVQRRRDEARDGSYYRGAGELIAEHYFPTTTRLQTHVMLYHLEPGVAEGEHVHLAGDADSCSADSSDEIYLVTRGEVVVIADGERTVLRAGDAAYTPHSMRHGVVNESAEPAELVLVFGAPRTD